MISSLNDIKQGLAINYNNEPYLVMESNFVRMQQRKPVMQTKLKNLISGKVLEYSFKAGEKVEEADLVRKKVNYLYKSGEEYNFMDNDSYEQFSLSSEQIGKKGFYLKDGTEVTLLFFNEVPINLEIPPKMNFKVTSAPPGVKGDSAQGRVNKLAILENGMEIGVPLFVKENDIIKINTETGEYVERVS